MKKILITTMALLSCFSAVFSQDRLSLNGEWLFKYAPGQDAADSLMNVLENNGYDRSLFDKIEVPSNWAVLGYEEPVYRGFKENKASEGIYLKDFSVPESLLEDRLLLHFGGVWSSAEIWLNGQWLGYHQGGYTSFALDVTEKLLPQNTLLVRVRQVCRGYEFDVYDDWTLGGIYRDVEIESMPRRRSIEKIAYKVDFDPDFCNATLKVTAMIHDMQKNTLPGNYPSPGDPYTLHVSLADKEGNTVVSRSIEVPAHISTDREIYCDMVVETPLHWTAETPNLYDLKVDMEEKGRQITHSRSCKVGFREVSTDGGVFRINGKPVKLRGVNRHDEYPTVGRATRREHWIKDLTLMKEANINYIRIAHYTPARGFVELCDSLGMYIGNEVSLGGAGTIMYDPSMIDAVLQRTYETIDRDINSPSIVYWSIGNEDPLTSQHMAAVKLSKAIDPTRPVLLPWRAEEWLPEEIDILAPHYWQVHEYDSLAANSSRPIITTEYTHAFGEAGFGSLQARWKALTRHPAGAGAAVWMWADQGVETPVKKGPKNRGISKDDYLRISEAGWDGIVDSYRNFTRDYHELKAVYAYAYPMDQTVGFTPGESSVEVRIANEYDFRNLNTVKIGYKIYKERDLLAEGALPSLDAVPHSYGRLRLPLSCIPESEPGARYYAWLTFTSADGYEIGTSSVELIPSDAKDAVYASRGDITSSKDGKKVILALGNVRYVFDKTKGLLLYVEKDGKKVVSDMRPALWHSLDRGDISVIGKKNVQKCPDLSKFTSQAKSWKVDVNGSKAVIKADVKHVANDENTFDAAYTYILTDDGRMTVRYELLPEFLVPSVPVAGMRMNLADDSVSDVNWFGQGDCDIYPNKKASGVLGWWTLSEDAEKKTLGMKAYRTIECGDMLAVDGEGYFECDGRFDVLSVYSDVLGRPEKGRKPLDVPQLLTGSEPFVGSFVLTVK